MRYNNTLLDGTSRWVCSQKPTNEEGKYCRGRVTQVPGQLQLEPYIHHDSWCVEIEGDEEMYRFTDSLHNTAQEDETLEATTILSMKKYGCSEHFKDRLAARSNDDSLARKINRRRNGGSLRLLNDLPFSQCELPLSFQRTISNQPFLAYDSKTNHPELRRTLLFTSTTQIQMAGEAIERGGAIFGSDATFASRSSNLGKKEGQKLLIHAYIPRHAHPSDDKERISVLIGTAYMEGMKEEDYYPVFKTLFDMLPSERRPLHWISDFELAQKNAVLRALPNIHFQFCYFHFVQMNKRAVKKLRMRHLFAQENFAAFFNEFCALPFLPTNEFYIGAAEVMNRLNFVLNRAYRESPTDLKKLLRFRDYLCDNFLARVNTSTGRRTKPPRYSPRSFSVYDAVLNGRPRTNNEGYNNGHHQKFNRGARPKLSRCIREDRKSEEKLRDAYRRSRRLGTPMLRKVGTFRWRIREVALYTHVRDYTDSPDHTEESRKLYLQGAHRIKRLYRRRPRVIREELGDADALTEEEISNIVLPGEGENFDD